VGGVGWGVGARSRGRRGERLGWRRGGVGGWERENGQGVRSTKGRLASHGEDGRGR